MGDAPALPSPAVEPRWLAARTLRQARAVGRLTQAELAQAAGVAPSTISAWETGARQPTLEQLATVLGAAGVEVHLTTRRSC